tara:strand:- start:132 stop:566 length:435 start_codon:yes stop_codon:yes gene_type:complete
LRTLSSDSVLGVLSETALITINPTNTIANPRIAPYNAAMISNGNCIPVSELVSEVNEIGLLVDEPSMDQINSASTTCESGQGPTLIDPDEEPPDETADTGISERIIPPSELLTNLRIPGSVEESPELLRVYSRETISPGLGLSG